MSDKRPILTYEAQINRVLPGLIPEIRERVLADAKARIEDLHYGDDNLLIGTGYQLAVNDALAVLTQPQTERCPEDCDGFGRLIGDSDGPCPACSGLESDGGGAATAAGVADAEHERRLETNRLLWNRVARLEEALRVIRGPEDRGPWMLIYRNAGGGYAGLQAIAETALAPEDSEPGPYAKAFRERVCPVPEFPGIEKEES